MQQFDGHLEPSTSDGAERLYFVSFENTWLNRLHLAPITRLTATLGTVNGVLVYRRLFFTSGNGGSDCGALVEERISPLETNMGAFHVSGAWSGKPYRVFVALTPGATDAQRHAAYDLNLSCLTRLGGCENAMSLLPSIAWGEKGLGSDRPEEKPSDFRMGGHAPLGDAKQDGLL
jgi:hypothetical protein